MKQKAIWLLLVLLLSASFVDCKKDEGEDLTNLALLNALGGGGDCLVSFPGKASIGVNRTRAIDGAGATSVIWGRIPFVNHPIAIVEALGMQNGDQITFTGIDVVANPETGGDEPVVYESADCPLAESTIVDGFVPFNSTNRGGAGPFVWTNDNAPGSYYFLLYIVGTSAPAATIQRVNL
ncbi:LIC20153 family lipoprotein [Leptospira andrefontaineae]|uniref:Uncharacterized protein n=1 Tax=Leptospira andrefontaineae TaxID=2484976 RepID=A0A4R9GXN5_9LEPT|nr:hypothetical protein [Leptospira andrefontaineae]TGK36623.1 hypothetical protein EHO65_17665 [Leptospira andrefontaineae]